MCKELYCAVHEGNFIENTVSETTGLNGDNVIHITGKYMGSFWEIFLGVEDAKNLTTEILQNISVRGDN